MLLVSGSKYRINGDLSIWKKLGFSEPIPKSVFEGYNQQFNSRMSLRLLFGDKGPQFLNKDDILKVINYSECEKVAFVFVTEPDGKKLRSAVVGLNDQGKYYNGPIFISTKPSLEDKEPLTRDSLIEGVAYYMSRVERQGFPHQRDCDRGIIHEKDKLKAWLKEAVSGNMLRLFFGIYKNGSNPKMQNVMLVDEEKFSRQDKLNEEEYAFDKGSGCCPGQ